MKKILKKIILKIVKLTASVFYNKRVIKGRHFAKNGEGWLWVMRSMWRQKILGFNRYIPWPVHHTIVISNPDHIHFDIDDLNNFQSPGCYFQNFDAHIYIGKGTYIGPNVGIITANHNILDLDTHTTGQDVILEEGCWIGMNSVILPGVVLKKGTIVGAGSVVTKSFSQENIVIAGSPAKIIKKNNE